MSGRPSLCMINYNGAAYLDRSLTAVGALRGSVHEVLLVDDASTDDSVQLVESRFPWVRVIRRPRNGGAAAARNSALQAAEADQVLLLDNDVYVPPHCADRLGEVLAQHPDAAVAMARIVHAAQPDRIQFDRPGSHFIGLQSVGPERPLSEGPKEPARVESLVSSCFLVDRKRLGRVVQFDEDFFIYLEDHDFGLRVRGRGHEVIAVPDVVCLHGEGTEHISLRRTASYSTVRIYSMIRNRWLVIAKSYHLRTLVLLAPALAVYEASQLAFVLKKGWLGEWLRAVGWMFTHRGLVAKKRRAVLGARVVPDRDLLRGGPIPVRDELAEGRLERWSLALLNGVISANWWLVRRWI